MYSPIRLRYPAVAEPLLSQAPSPDSQLLYGYTVVAPFGRSHLAAYLSVSLRVASVRQGLDFAQYLCHSIGQHHLAAGPYPAHNNRINQHAVNCAGYARGSL
ncbi:MAG: hypothetical protein JRF30_01820 [Deltaproteobacteria bacterium]|nr:hypothetical protein [Deltaproteobacteria bacterium]MBW1796296.1 hypothetical protein [Deltaproteobacteria bacterium]MBW2329681.1 hypothetical protein [Deltaproteobacteria bacterium]